MRKAEETGTAAHVMALVTRLSVSPRALLSKYCSGRRCTLASTLLFGAFLAWAVADRISLKRRPIAPAAGRATTAPPSRFNDAIAVVAGLGLYAAFLGVLHVWLIGVSPR